MISTLFRKRVIFFCKLKFKVRKKSKKSLFYNKNTNNQNFFSEIISKVIKLKNYKMKIKFKNKV